MSEDAENIFQVMRSFKTGIVLHGIHSPTELHGSIEWDSLIDQLDSASLPHQLNLIEKQCYFQPNV